MAITQIQMAKATHDKHDGMCIRACMYLQGSDIHVHLSIHVSERLGELLTWLVHVP